MKSRHILRPPSSRPGRQRSLTRRLLGSGLVLLLLALLLPASVLAQEDPDRLLWEWQLLEYRADPGDDELTPVPPGVGITAGLFAGSIDIEGACSTARADFSLPGAEAILIGAPVVEGRGCDPATQAVDDAFYAGLQQTSEWQTSGGCAGEDAACRPSILTFRDVVGDPVMRLTSATLPADPGISRWNLGRIGTAEGDIAPVITGVEPWIEFQRGGHVVGSSGCGAFLGSYTTNGNTMSISDLVPRAPDCTSALRDQADTVLDTLGQITDFEILPAGLVLKDESGLTRLAFEPAIDLENRTWTPFEISESGEVQEEISGLLSTSAVRLGGRNADGLSYCRSFAGRLLSSGLALTISEPTPDESLRCPRRRLRAGPSPQEIEQGFLAALQRTASHALRGDELVLMDVDGSPVMRLAPQADLAGPTWVLTEMAGQRSRARPIRPIGDEPLTAVFSDIGIGILQGSTGVRSYNAVYDLPRGGQIDISDPEPLGQGCGRRRADDPGCVQERRFLAYLDAAERVVVRPEEMRLHQGQRVLLRFVPEDVYLAQRAAEEEEARSERG